MDTNTLANALKSVFGNNTTDNPSSTSKIPYCGSDGLPAGLASMSNLASVLGAMVCDITGAPYRKSPIQASARTSIRTSGLYTYTGNPYGTLIVFNAGYYQCQIDIPADLQYQYVTIRTSNNDKSDWSSYALEKHS